MYVLYLLATNDYTMFVISIYGRAGQGVESAVMTLAKSIPIQLKTQAIFFPSQERYAAVFGQIKIDKIHILSKQIENYDIAVVFDRGLDTKNIVRIGKERSSVIFNSEEKIINPLIKKKKMKSYFLNATDIALRNTGKPMINISMLGAAAKLYPKIPLKNLRALVEQNKEQLMALEEGYKNVR